MLTLTGFAMLIVKLFGKTFKGICFNSSEWLLLLLCAPFSGKAFNCFSTISDTYSARQSIWLLSPILLLQVVILYLSSSPPQILKFSICNANTRVMNLIVYVFTAFNFY